MRADVNVSVRKPGGEFGTRTETKNVNSVRFVMAVVEHEARRQVELIESGGTVAQETRLYDPDKNVTPRCAPRRTRTITAISPTPICSRSNSTRRSSRNAARLFRNCPAPSASAMKSGHNPLQRQRFNRRGRDRALVRYAARRGRGAEAGRELGRRRLFGALNRRGESIDQSPVSPQHAAELLGLVADGTISGTIAKQVFEIMLETGQGAGEIVEERGLRQTSDTGAIDAEIDKVLAANADKVAEYRNGKEQLFGFFVGQAMKAMAGKGNPKLVNERLRAKLRMTVPRRKGPIKVVL